MPQLYHPVHRLSCNACDRNNIARAAFDPRPRERPSLQRQDAQKMSPPSSIPLAQPCASTYLPLHRHTSVQEENRRKTERDTNPRIASVGGVLARGSRLMVRIPYKPSISGGGALRHKRAWRRSLRARTAPTPQQMRRAYSEMRKQENLSA